MWHLGRAKHTIFRMNREILRLTLLYTLTLTIDDATGLERQVLSTRAAPPIVRVNVQRWMLKVCIISYCLVVNLILQTELSYDLFAEIRDDDKEEKSDILSLNTLLELENL